MKRKKTNPDLHIICGRCGCGCTTKIRYAIIKELDPENGEIDVVVITCDRCGSLVYLSDVIDKK